MGHTNSTTNLQLPQFIGTDKPTWLGDINGAFAAIDAYAGTNDAAVAAAASDASSAISQAATAVNTANTANTTAGNASTAANNAVGVANTANAIAGTVDAKVGLLADLNTTDRTSIVNAINEVEAGIHTVTVHTAAANQTYAAQLTELKPYFEALTAEQKQRCALDADGFIYDILYTGSGYFNIVILSGSDIQYDIMNINACTFNVTVSGTTTDKSSDTNSYPISLIIR